MALSPLSLFKMQHFTHIFDISVLVMTRATFCESALCELADSILLIV